MWEAIPENRASVGLFNTPCLNAEDGNFSYDWPSPVLRILKHPVQIGRLGTHISNLAIDEEDDLGKLIEHHPLPAQQPSSEGLSGSVSGHGG